MAPPMGRFWLSILAALLPSAGFFIRLATRHLWKLPTRWSCDSWQRLKDHCLFVVPWEVV